MGCRLIPRKVDRMNTRKKKKNNDTGAKKLIRPASGPGCSICGIFTARSYPETRFWYFHSRSQPFSLRRSSVGDIAFSGKSNPEKSVRNTRSKSRACETAALWSAVFVEKL